MELRTRIALGLAGVAIAATTPLAQRSEGVRLIAYLDPLGNPTICAGHTSGVRLGQMATAAECDQLLYSDLMDVLQGAARCIHPALTFGQTIAILDFGLNFGVTKLCGSTMVRLLNAGEPAPVWCAQLDRWVWGKKAGIWIRWPGLVKRRAEERTLCDPPPPNFGNVVAGVTSTARLAA